MYQLHTEKQQKYFKEVIRLHYEEGYGENQIAGIIPIDHAAAAKRIAILAREKGEIRGAADMGRSRGKDWYVGVWRFQGRRPGRTHQRHDDGRDAAGQGLRKHRRGHRRRGPLRQPPSSRGHRHDGSCGGIEDGRRP